jgi:hypothetical protein
MIDELSNGSMSPFVFNCLIILRTEGPNIEVSYLVGYMVLLSTEEIFPDQGIGINPLKRRILVAQQNKNSVGFPHRVFD